MGVNPNSGLSEDYIERLKSEHRTAKAAHSTYAKAASKAGKEYAQAALHHNELKAYCRQVSVTYVMIGDAYSYLGTMLNHTKEVSKVLDFSNQSLSIIAHFTKCLCEEVENLRGCTRALIEIVEGIGDDFLNTGDAKLLTCLKELEAEIKVAITDSGVAIEATIELYRCLLELTHGIGTEENDVTTGLVNDFEQMQAILCCKYSAGIGVEITLCETNDGTPTQTEIDLAACCPNDGNVGIKDRECGLAKPAICEGQLFGNTFFSKKITEAMETARKLAEMKKCVLRFYEKKSAGALAKMEAIKKALDAATKAKALCK